MSATLNPETQTLTGAYLVNGTVGNAGSPGAPLLHFSLVVVPNAHSVSGTVEITQAIQGPNSRIVIKNVTGVIRPTGFGSVTQVVALEGIYYQSLTPPAIGSVQQNFSAHLALDNAWNGVGGFSYGETVINNVPVKSTK